MRVTSKGQITIPQSVREKAGFLPGTDVEVIYDNGEVRIVRTPPDGQRRTRGQRIVERLWGSGNATHGMTTDEIMELTRGEGE